MLSFTRQAAESRLARLTVRGFHFSPSWAKEGAASEKGAALPTSSSVKKHDPGLEQRRAARLAREALRTKHAGAAAKGIAPNKTNNRDPMMSSTTAAAFSGPPGQKGQTQIRQRKRSHRDQVQSSGTQRGGTERSRMGASEPGPAETIMAFAQRGAANRRAARTEGSKFSGGRFETTDRVVIVPPQFTGPEPISSNIAATLNTVPNLTSSLPRLPAARKLRKMPKNWVKEVYGGDYSQYRLDKSQYLKGARGLKSSYAKIIIGRNPTIPLGSQQQLIATIQRAIQEHSP